MGIDHNSWKTTAQNRAAWWGATNKGAPAYESRRLETAKRHRLSLGRLASCPSCFHSLSLPMVKKNISSCRIFLFIRISLQNLLFCLANLPFSILNDTRHDIKHFVCFILPYLHFLLCFLLSVLQCSFLFCFILYFICVVSVPSHSSWRRNAWRGDRSRRMPSSNPSANRHTGFQPDTPVSSTASRGSRNRLLANKRSPRPRERAGRNSPPGTTANKDQERVCLPMLNLTTDKSVDKSRSNMYTQIKHLANGGEIQQSLSFHSL